ncbi:MAG: TetR/AcrR family transcriptional regulator, partial [Chloroflexi bacterium]|nr:TetR/AcrR family transcriptional regulator [Chloroflexota bacterium]
MYLAFATKAAILSATYHVAVAGDDEPVAIPDREFHHRTLADPDPRRLIAGFVHFAAHAGVRTAPLFAVLEQAAPSSPELAGLLNKTRHERLQGVERVATALQARGALQTDVP